MTEKGKGERGNLPVPYDDAEYVEAEPIERPEPEPELVGIELSFTIRISADGIETEFYDEGNDWVGLRPLISKRD